jgi:hypothetical protein
MSAGTEKVSWEAIREAIDMLETHLELAANHTAALGDGTRLHKTPKKHEGPGVTPAPCSDSVLINHEPPRTART